MTEQLDIVQGSLRVAEETNAEWTAKFRNLHAQHFDSSRTYLRGSQADLNGNGVSVPISGLGNYSLRPMTQNIVEEIFRASGVMPELQTANPGADSKKLTCFRQPDNACAMSHVLSQTGHCRHIAENRNKRYVENQNNICKVCSA